MSETMLIKQDAVEPFLKNGYLLACQQTRQGIYIDPGEEASLLLPKVQEYNIELMAIVNTHAHIDHISGIGLVKKQWDVPIYLHPDDEPLYENLSTQAQRFGLDYPPAPPLDHQLQEGQDLAAGARPQPHDPQALLPLEEVGMIREEPGQVAHVGREMMPQVGRAPCLALEIEVAAPLAIGGREGRDRSAHLGLILVAQGSPHHIEVAHLVARHETLP